MYRYLWDLTLQVWRYLPLQYRLTNFYDLLCALLFPIQQLHTSFFDYAHEARLNASYIGSTVIVEHILNLKFNDGLEGIYIENVFFQLFIQQRYIYYIQESKPPLYIKRLEETGGLGSYFLAYLAETYTPEFNFIVHIPNALLGTFDETELRAIVESYIGPDKTFIIQYY